MVFKFQIPPWALWTLKQKQNRKWIWMAYARTSSTPRRSSSDFEQLRNARLVQGQARRWSNRAVKFSYTSTLFVFILQCKVSWFLTTFKRTWLPCLLNRRVSRSSFLRPLSTWFDKHLGYPPCADVIYTFPLRELGTYLSRTKCLPYKQSQLCQSPFSSSFPIFSCSLSILLMEEQALHGKVSLCVKITCRLLFDSVDSLPPLLNWHRHRGRARRRRRVPRWRRRSWFKSLCRLPRSKLRPLLRDLKSCSIYIICHWENIFEFSISHLIEGWLETRVPYLGGERVDGSTNLGKVAAVLGISPRREQDECA